MKVINCSKHEHCIHFMQYERYKKLYEELQKEYNTILRKLAQPDSEIEEYLEENFTEEDWNDEL